MDTLHTLLDRNLQHPPEYRGALSNHLPMALHALRELGADDARLQQFFTSYAKRFDGLPRAVAGAPLADWRQAIGRIEDFDRMRAGFAAQLAARGLDASLREVLPALWPGAAAAAFHGLIRTAHAVQSGHAGEIAAALAYWAVRWQSVPDGATDSPSLSFANWSAQLEATAARTRSSEGLISTRIESVARSGRYAGLASALVVQAGLLAQLSEWAGSLYSRSGNFTVLHVVTGLRATRVLWPWVDDPAAVVPCLVRAVAAAVLASNLTLRDDEPTLLGWDELRKAAVASDDEHVIKLVHACKEGAERAEGEAGKEGKERKEGAAACGEGPWARAASRALG